MLLKYTKDELFLMLYEREEYSPEMCALVEEVLREYYGATEEELRFNPDSDSYIEGTLGTRDLLLKTVAKLVDEKEIIFYSGEKEYEYDDFSTHEDDGHCEFSFKYQGGFFYANASNDNVDVCIETFCDYYGLRHKKKIAMMKEAANRVNKDMLVTVYCAEDEKESCVAAYCAKSFLFVPTIPGLEFYLIHRLRRIMKAKRKFYSIMEEQEGSEHESLIDSQRMLRHLKTRHLKKTNFWSNNINDMDDIKKTKTKGTRDMFLETLENMGCPYETDEDEESERIYFTYQGEDFFVDATNNSWHVHVWATNLEHVDLYDIDEFTILRKAINEANLNCATTTVYTIDEEGKSVDMHCKSTFVFPPQMPYLESYLRVQLNDFFRTHQILNTTMERMREQNHT